MRTICLAFKSTDCSYDICQKMCNSAFSGHIDDCLASCIINLPKSPDNAQAKDILEYFLQKGAAHESALLTENIKTSNDNPGDLSTQISHDKD